MSESADRCRECCDIADDLAGGFCAGCRTEMIILIDDIAPCLWAQLWRAIIYNGHVNNP